MKRKRTDEEEEDEHRRQDEALTTTVNEANQDDPYRADEAGPQFEDGPSMKTAEDQEEEEEEEEEEKNGSESQLGNKKSKSNEPDDDELNKGNGPNEGNGPKNRDRNILLACTGSVAAVKIVELCLKLCCSNSEGNEKKEARSNTETHVRVIVTKAASHFLFKGPCEAYNNSKSRYITEFDDGKDRASSSSTDTEPSAYHHHSRRDASMGLNVDMMSMSMSMSMWEEFQGKVKSGEVEILQDEDEWNGYHEVGRDKVLHIELRKWANILVIAPLSANTLAKMAYGFSDNLLSCVVRAWDSRNKIIVAPAMNTLMWNNPITSEHISKLQQRDVKVIMPVSKTLACKDTGIGAMAPVDEIVETIWSYLDSEDES